MLLYRRPLEVRLFSQGHPSPKGVLVVYSTGDGGWHGLDDQVFKWIGDWGYPAAGFSSRSYLDNLRYFSDSDTTTPRRLARDFQSIIQFAEDRLGLPAATRIILVGNSRGAGLSVVAAGQGGLKSRLAGLAAVALTKEEEHVLRYRRSARRSASGAPRRGRFEIKTYEYLPRLAGFPVAVIQSENDGYLPASAARTLFGPDTSLHRLRAISAHNHSFKGGCLNLYRELDDALRWISDSSSPANAVLNR